MGKNQNLNNRPSYVAKLPKTDHNLSHDFSFTASTGHLLPIDQQIMNVGERITYTPHIFARSNPLLSAAMADVDVYVDLFFVPMQMLLLLGILCVGKRMILFLQCGRKLLQVVV